MKTFFKKIADALTESTLAEMSIDTEQKLKTGAPEHSFAEAMEERLVEAAYAEAADYEDIKRSLEAKKRETARPDECQFGDNDLCYVEV